MNILKNISSTVSQPAQIAKLDRINERRLEQYDREINELVTNMTKLYTTEEIAQLEQQVIDHVFQAYDDEAGSYMGRAVNANWEEGGGDNLEVRKRMLNRELRDRRGKLAEAVTPHRQKASVEMEKVTLLIEQHEQKIKATLPSDQESIDKQIDEIRVALSELLNPSYGPNGLTVLDNLVNSGITTLIQTASIRIADENQRIIAENERIKALAELEKATLLIEQHEQKIKAALPSDQESIDKQIDEIRVALSELLNPSYGPNGLTVLDNLVNSSITTLIQTASIRIADENQRIIAENERIRQETIKDFRLKTFAALYDALQLGVTETSATVKSNATAENGSEAEKKHITAEIIDNLRKDIDDVVGRLLGELNSIKDLR